MKIDSSPMFGFLRLLLLVRQALTNHSIWDVEIPLLPSSLFRLRNESKNE